MTSFYTELKKLWNHQEHILLLRPGDQTCHLLHITNNNELPGQHRSWSLKRLLWQLSYSHAEYVLSYLYSSDFMVFNWNNVNLWIVSGKSMVSHLHFPKSQQLDKKMMGKDYYLSAGSKQTQHLRLYGLMEEELLRMTPGIK